MNRRDAVSLQHMLDAAREALSFVKSATRDSLESDRMLSLALVGSLEILAYAASKVTEAERAKYPQIPWNRLVGLEDDLLDDDFNVKHDQIWRTVTETLPPLVGELERIIPPLISSTEAMTTEENIGPASRHIDVPEDELAAFCRRNHIRKLSFFGSVLRDDFGPESDLDVLVEFEPGATVSLFDMASMEREMSAFLGRKVDLRTPDELSHYFRDAVLNTAQVQYERTG